MTTHSRPRARAAVTSLTCLVLALTLAACAGEDPEPTAGDVAPSPSESVSPEATEPSEPTEATGPTEATEPTSTLSGATGTPTSEPPATSGEREPAQTAPGATAVDVAGRLLPASGMGKLNAEWTWSAGNDFDSEPRRLAACHRFGLDVVGADDVAVREYSSELDAGVRAFHLVADLVDEVNARRAYAVLQSWHDGCRQRLEERSKGRDGVQVTDLERVTSRADAATSYVVFQPTATGGTRIENVGISRDGRLVDVVVVRLEGDDFNYPRGRTPAAVGVRNAAQ